MEYRKGATRYFDPRGRQVQGRRHSRPRNLRRPAVARLRTQVEVSAHRTSSLAKGSRDNLHTANGANPGPGSYNASSTFGGPKAFISGRFARSSTDQVPGPGQYNPDPQVRQTRTAFQYSMGGRPNTSSKGGAPGPGAYEINRPQSKGGVKFSREPRSGLNQSSSKYVPGPGSYGSIERDFTRSNGPKYTY